MVSEAVAELKGEELRPPAEVKLDLAVDANLPPDYVAKEELRLEAYRRLAAVTTQAEVDDIHAEWLDRYGPVPPAADALLAAGRPPPASLRCGAPPGAGPPRPPPPPPPVPRPRPRPHPPRPQPPPDPGLGHRHLQRRLHCLHPE